MNHEQVVKFGEKLSVYVVLLFLSVEHSGLHEGVLLLLLEMKKLETE